MRLGVLSHAPPQSDGQVVHLGHREWGQTFESMATRTQRSIASSLGTEPLATILLAAAAATRQSLARSSVEGAFVI